MENMLVLADDDGIIDLDVLLSKARNAFERFAAAENIDSWII